MDDDIEQALKDLVLDIKSSVADRLKAINALLKWQRDKIKVDLAAARRARAEAARAREQARKLEARALATHETLQLSKAKRRHAKLVSRLTEGSNESQ